MKIVLDARIPNAGGMYSYSRALLQGIMEIDHDNQYTVIYDKTHGKLGLKGCHEIVVESDNPWRYLLWNNTRLPELLKIENADIYHSFKQVFLRQSRTKKILTLHSAYNIMPDFRQYYNLQERLYWAPMLKAGARTADSIISVSYFDSRNLSKILSISPEKIHVTQLAADQRFKIIKDSNELKTVRKNLNLPERFIVYVGTIYPIKNVKNIIKIYHRITQSLGKDIKLVIVGRKGWGDKVVTQKIKELNLESQVIFTGHQWDYLPHIYTMAELLLFPSYYEAFCAPPLEALSCGTPVVASNRGGIPEVVENCGLLKDPDDVAGLTASCLRILTDSCFKTNLIKCGLEHVKKFTWQKCVESTIKVYIKTFETLSVP
ncbi:glycosyltransferase family 4 protein [Desulfobacterota bacterium M19]